MTTPGPRVDLLTAAEAAVRLRTTAYNVTAMCRAGKIRATKPFGTWLIPQDAIDELLEAKANRPTGAGAGAA